MIGLKKPQHHVRVTKLLRFGIQMVGIVISVDKRLLLLRYRLTMAC